MLGITAAAPAENLPLDPSEYTEVPCSLVTLVNLRRFSVCNQGGNRYCGLDCSNSKLDRGLGSLVVLRIFPAKVSLADWLCWLCSSAAHPFEMMVRSEYSRFASAMAV